MPSARRSLLSVLMRPCLYLMSKFSLRFKLLGMLGSVLLISLCFGVAVLLAQMQGLESVDTRQAGLELMQQSGRALSFVQQIRAAGNANQDPSHQEKLRVALANISTLSTVSKQSTQQDHGRLRTEAQELSSLLSSLASEFSNQKYPLDAQARQNLDQLETNLLVFSNSAVQKSGLLQDADATAYSLADLALNKLTALNVLLSKIAMSASQTIQDSTQDGVPDLSKSSISIAQLSLLREQLQIASAVSQSMHLTWSQSADAAPSSFNEVQQANQQLLASLQKISGEQIAANLANEIRTQAQVAVTKNDVLQVELQKRLSDLLHERAKSLRWFVYLLLVVLLGMSFATIYLSFGFYLNLIHAVKDLEHAAEVVASGDLTTTTKLEGSDELSKTALAIDKANFNLSALVANVRTNASMVLELGKELSEDIGRMAIRTEQQANSLVDTASNMGTLSETVKNNAANAQSVDNLASNVRLIAESSNETMRAAVDTMQGIHASSIKVHEIVSMIDKIAFQTDILALNAAVEAAHAGEQGRGFAVVANEVRGLAQRTADSARQIRNLIDDSVQRVETGVKQIHEVNTTLSEIVAGIRSLATDIKAISTASIEQSQSLIHISQAVHELDEITKSNSAMVDNAKSASAELGLRAEKLTTVVAAFKLRQGTADEAHSLVKKAMSLFKTQGMDLLDYITRDPHKMFADRDMYVFAFDRRGQYRAFAGNAAKLEVNLFNVPGLDGRKLVADAFDLPEKGGWVDYAIENPLLKRVEIKTSYIERISDDIVVGCGVYKSV